MNEKLIKTICMKTFIKIHNAQQRQFVKYLVLRMEYSLLKRTKNTTIKKFNM